MDKSIELPIILKNNSPGILESTFMLDFKALTLGRLPLNKIYLHISRL
jgi:hypothetical protein